MTSTQSATAELRQPYPAIEPFKSGHIKVSDIHNVYYEQSGNPKGNPVIYLHGGPGGGCDPKDRTYFDPEKYHIILMDQRGAGRSTPAACLEENTTWHLIDDIERLRQHVGVEKWVVFGGSWGSTLALAYAEKHPDRVKALILRGIFMLRRKELVYFYNGVNGDPEGGGTGFIYPDQFDKFMEPIPVVERGDLMGAYYRRLTGNDHEVQLRCARAWSVWEMYTSSLFPNPDRIAKAAEDAEFALKFARIESHYFVNGGFFTRDDQILHDVPIIRNAKIPGIIVQGRYDLICPFKSAYDLKKAWPEVDLQVVQDAGHSAREPGIQAKLIEAADFFRDL